MTLKFVVCRLLSLLLVSAGFLMASPPVRMKLLVIAWDSSDMDYRALTRDLIQIGVPYDALFVNSLTPDASGNRLNAVVLTDSTTGNGLYQGIIETDSSFAVCTATCQTLLSVGDVSKLNAYALQYAVRMVCYDGWPEAAWGLQPGDYGASYSAASPLQVTLTSAGTAVFPYLNPAALIPVSGRGGGSVWAYKAIATAAANETTTPILVSGSYAVGVTHTTADGRETLALAMSNYPTLLHTTAFSYGVLNWVTKGVFLGFRRVYLGPQMDDILLGNRLYAPTLSQCPADPSCPNYEVSGPDLQGLENWQANLQSDPLFGSFHTTFAYNGIGTTWFNPADPVFAVIASSGSRFTWVSHTWDHPDLDCYTTDSNGNCVAATLAQSLAELNQNIAIAPALGIALDRTDMVTPRNSGLANANFLQAAVQAGIQNIVYPGNPATPQTGIVNPINPAIFEIPRPSPDLYDNVSSPLTGAYGSWPDEFNAQYGPGGTNPTYSQNQTYSQILAIESDLILRNNMLTYEPYPLAFHIANMALYDGSHSLLSDLMDAATGKYKSMFTLPVLTLDLNTIAPLLKNRANYDVSKVVGVYTPGVGVVLTTTGAAVIPVTGACSEATCSTYGGQIQDGVSMAANSTVTLSLTGGESVALASVSLNPGSVVAGNSSTGTVTLSSAAPSGGISVSLSSDSTSATVPATVTVAAGSTMATFTATTTTAASAATATITASYSGVSTTASLTITASAALSSVSLNPTSVAGGSFAAGTITLSSAAPSGGLSVALSSNNAAAKVPASVTVPAGSATGTFTVTTTAGTSAVMATITAGYNSVSTTASLTITASAALSSVSLNPTSVAGGSSAAGTITLSSAAPSGGLSVALSSNNAAAKVPASVTVPAGSATGTFTVTTTAGTSAATATVTASYSGVSTTASLTITASAALSSVSLNPTSVAGGSSAAGTITLSSAAPSGGLSVALSSNNAAAKVPASVTVPAGSATGTFTVTTTAGTSAVTATITASYNSVKKTAVLSVAAVALSSLSVNLTSVKGGTVSTGTITLSGPAPTGGMRISLSTNKTAVSSVPSSITIAAGSTMGTFAVTTRSVLVTAQIALTAKYGSTSKTATLTVTP